MDFSSIKEQSNSIYEKLTSAHREYFDNWLNDMLFTWRWWVALGLIIIPWTVWFIVRKKESSDRLLYAGFSSMLLSFIFDFSGVSIGLWYYPVSALPIMPAFFQYDFCVLPVVTMLFLQFKPKLNKFIKAALYAATASFVFQPFMRWIGLYANKEWKDIYSFPILFVIYLIANFFVTRKNFDELK